MENALKAFTEATTHEELTDANEVLLQNVAELHADDADIEYAVQVMLNNNGFPDLGQRRHEIEMASL
jgi:DNA-binding MltR family transcriptional regulator